eukprot:GHRQ01003359.1.p1 GENE.GHRQ01003359.1~~GHRQ01003359.1.p1  ORF type:complete len:315 (+),score=107.48 GHRQ01003359.1:51-995(+)
MCVPATLALCNIGRLIAAAHSAAAESRPATLKEIKEVAQEIKEVAQEIKEAVAPVQVLVCALYSSQHWAPASSTGSAKQKFRPVALSAYGAMDGDKTWCVVTGMWWPAVAAQVGKDTVVYVRNAHIFARRSNTGLQQMEWRTMGLGSSPDVVENVLPMMASVEAAFDNQRMCVLPVMDAQGVRFMIHILESTLKDQLVYGSWFSTARRDYPEWTAPDARLRVREGLGAVAPQALRFGQLDKQQLVFKTAQRPATRCLMHHAFWALQRAKEEGWDTRGLDIPRDHFGWQSPTVQDRMEATGLWVYGPHGAAGDGQ